MLWLLSQWLLSYFTKTTNVNLMGLLEKNPPKSSLYPHHEFTTLCANSSSVDIFYLRSKTCDLVLNERSQDNLRFHPMRTIYMCKIFQFDINLNTYFDVDQKDK